MVDYQPISGRNLTKIAYANNEKMAITIREFFTPKAHIFRAYSRQWSTNDPLFMNFCFSGVEKVRVYLKNHVFSHCNDVIFWIRLFHQSTN